MEKVGAGIVAAGGENLARACVHFRVVALLFVGRAEEVGDVPHGDGGGHRHRAIDHPVARHEPRFRSVPVVQGEGGCRAGEDAVDQSR
jgi:hypothetical protein